MLRNVKKYTTIILVVLVMTAIYFFSNQPGTQSRAVSNAVVQIVGKPKLFSIRKIAHFAMFSLLGITVMMMLYNVWNKLKDAMIGALAISIMYALFDELHQVFVPGRDASVKDVAIDTLGAVVGILLMCFLIAIIKRERKKYA